jgi:hypothetical protein
LAQLKAPGLQKGKLLNPFSALPLRLLPPPLDVGSYVGHARGVLLIHLLSQVHLHKIVLQKANSLSEALCLSASRASDVVLSACTLNTLSQASLSARVAQSTTSLTRATMLSHAAMAS